MSELTDRIIQINEENHAHHMKRVRNAMKWWDEHVTKEEEIPVGSRLSIDGVDCVCTFNVFEYPACEIDVQPLAMEHDLGSGAGNTHNIKFKA